MSKTIKNNIKKVFDMVEKIQIGDGIVYVFSLKNANKINKPDTNIEPWKVSK